MLTAKWHGAQATTRHKQGPPTIRLRWALNQIHDAPMFLEKIHAQYQWSLWCIFVCHPHLTLISCCAAVWAQACGSEHKTSFFIILHHRFIWRPCLFLDPCWCVGGSSITILPLLVEIVWTFTTLTSLCSLCACEHVTVSRYCRFCTRF